MRVALDATPLTLTSGGLVRYTSELSRALAAEFPDDAYVLVSDQPFALPANAPANLVKGGAPRDVLDRRWWLWGLSREMGRQNVALFHGTDFAVPYLPLRPSVMTLHDVSPWLNGAWHGDAGRVRRRVPWLLRMGLATMVITPSEAVRRQVVDLFRVSATRVIAVPEAAADWFRPQANRGGGSARSARAGYFLCVATIEPRKNLPVLIEAWRPVYSRHGVELWLAGRRRGDAPRIPDVPGLRWLGEVADHELPGLYSNALGFVYPSLYEGFGLPVLEAMQCGACVITSNDAAIGEVAGGVAVRVDAGDERAWSEALAACAAGGEWIEERRRRSLARAALFSWSRTARMTREVYEEARNRFGG